MERQRWDRVDSPVHAQACSGSGGLVGGFGLPGDPHAHTRRPTGGRLRKSGPRAGSAGDGRMRGLQADSGVRGTGCLEDRHARVCACPTVKLGHRQLRCSGGGRFSSEMLVLMLVVAAATLRLCPLARAQPLCRWGGRPGLGVLAGVGEAGAHLSGGPGGIQE